VAVGPALTMAAAFVIEWITGKRSVPHDVLRSIAKYSGLALLVYAYIKFWDLAAVTYYGKSPSVLEALKMLNEQTPYNLAFWVGEILMGIFIPALMFLVPRYNRRPVNLVFGALLAVMGIIINRWNTTVSGLFVPLSYSPGVLYQGQAGRYLPALPEWGVAVGIIGYGLTMLTLGVLFLPLFSKEKNA
jgi:Ni/Fe-hydrogenase subunit HybB-like protein